MTRLRHTNLVNALFYLPRPAVVLVPLLLKGRITKGRGRLYETEGTIELPDGTVTAQGTARVFIIDPA